MDSGSGNIFLTDVLVFIPFFRPGLLLWRIFRSTVHICLVIFSIAFFHLFFISMVLSKNGLCFSSYKLLFKYCARKLTAALCFVSLKTRSERRLHRFLPSILNMTANISFSQRQRQHNPPRSNLPSPSNYLNCLLLSVLKFQMKLNTAVMILFVFFNLQSLLPSSVSLTCLFCNSGKKPTIYPANLRGKEKPYLHDVYA